MAGPERIAILGGGIAGLTAAFELSEVNKQLEDRGRERRYAITVYQAGWRLGGKGASSRGKDERIEEHGLHLWGGYYENAFRLMRRCYEELPAGAGWKPWRDVFERYPCIGWPIETASEEGGFCLRYIEPEFDDGVAPGDGAPRLPTPREQLVKLVGLMGDLLTDLAEAPGPRLLDRYVDDVASELEGLTDSLLPLLRTGFDAIAALITAPRGPGFPDRLQRRVRRFRDTMHPRLSGEALQTAELRRYQVMIDLGITIVAGMVGDGVVDDGFDVIDRYEFREWLERWGASRDTLRSRVVQSIYDYVFAYQGGDGFAPALAAGTALRLCLRFNLLCRGAVMWRMNCGMGEAVFAPLYAVLKNRGVEFRFFHRVAKLVPSEPGAGGPARPIIKEVRLFQQLGQRAQYQNYEPLRPLDAAQYGAPFAWPEHPDIGPLVGRARAAALHERLAKLGPWTLEWGTPHEGWAGEQELVLEHGAHYDRLVLAISLGALAGPDGICGELAKQRWEWARMLTEIETVQTQAVQLWTDAPFRREYQDDRVVVTGADQPFNTWADMSHLQNVEGRSARRKFVLYSCGPRRDHEPERIEQRWNAWRRQWTETRDQPPRIKEKDPETYFRDETGPSDRYVLSLPGTTTVRLRADGRLRPGGFRFEHLYLAGDWVRTGLNFGCMEAAVMAGMQAAREISGSPRFVYGESDFPEAQPEEQPAAPAWADRPLEQPLPAWIERPVERVADPVQMPPYHFPDVRTWGFVIPARYDALARLADRLFNEPSARATDYQPVDLGSVAQGRRSAVLIGCHQYGAAQGTKPGTTPGTFSYSEVVIAVPLLTGSRNGPLRMVWYYPYVFVNSPFPLAAGREIYGFSKTFALISSVLDAEQARFAVQAFPFESPPASRSPAEGMFSSLRLVHEAAPHPPVETLLEIRCPPGDDWVDSLELLTSRAWRAAEANVKRERPDYANRYARERFTTIGNLLLGDFTLVTLRQVRSLSDPRRVDLQDIVEIDAKVKERPPYGYGRLLDVDRDASVVVRPVRGYPIAEELGIAEVSRILVAYEAYVSVTLDNGRVVG